MKLTISNEESNLIISIDIPDSLSLQDFKAYLEAETSISPELQILRFNGHTINEPEKSLKDFGIGNDDLIVLLKLSTASTAPTASAASTGSSEDIDRQAELTRTQFLNNPQLNQHLQQTNPHLHSLLNDPEAFKTELITTFQNGGFHGRSSTQQAEMARLQQNPDDPENQARILEMIRQEQIDENMQLAYDISPESFTSVNMLYINIKVNNHKVQAFVDSGAQTTIISPKLAAEIGIDRLIDRRFQGEARGVGSQRIEGKIHSVPITIGDSNMEIPCSFIVLDTQVDLLFGLDMLRRHKCVIDLGRDCLVVGGGQIETRFLQELEIKNNAFGASQPRSGFGGNIFSDPQPLAANSTGTSKQRPAEAAAAAASKRQNTGPSSTGASSTFKEEDIKQLTSLGFSREEAIFALQQANGNVEVAASILFQ